MLLYNQLTRQYVDWGGALWKKIYLEAVLKRERNVPGLRHMDTLGFRLQNVEVENWRENHFSFVLTVGKI